MVTNENSGKFALEQEAKDYGSLQFRTLGDVQAWLSAESDYWSWCAKSPPHTLGFVDDKRNTFWGWIEKAKNHCAAAINGPEDSKNHTVWKNNLRQYAQSGLVSRTGRAQFIQNLRQGDQGDIVAGAALGIYLGSALDPQPNQQPQEMRYPSFRGRLAMALFDLGVGPDTTTAVTSSAYAIAADFSKQLEVQSQANSSLLTSLRTSHAQVMKDHEEAQAAHNARVATAIDEVTTSKDQALKAMDDKRAAFNEFMRLKAPVEYWSQKATDHVDASRWWLRALGIWAVVGSAAILFVFHTVYGDAVSLASTPQPNGGSAMIVLTAGAAVATTIIFWVARFLSRLFLSERHMAIDANLRATLAETYLALTEEGKVSDTDRALVLPALFRSSSDGIVQEDTSIDGLVAMFARHLERPK